GAPDVRSGPAEGQGALRRAAWSAVSALARRAARRVALSLPLWVSEWPRPPRGHSALPTARGVGLCLRRGRPYLGAFRHCLPWSRSTLPAARGRSEEHTSELQSRFDLVCRL